MTCRDCEQQLTGYLDGDVADERGAIIRGHLRGCAACQLVANHESIIRDGLRALPSADPPADLWAAIAAQVAQQEVALATQPAWQRLTHRLRDYAQTVLEALALPALGRVGRVGRVGRISLGATVAVTAGALLWWKVGQRVTPGIPRTSQSQAQVAVVVPVPTLAAAGSATPLVPPSVAIERNNVVLAPKGLALTNDVSAELDAEQQSIDASYRAAVEDLQRDAAQVYSSWSAAARASFTQRNEQLADAVVAAKDYRLRARAYRVQLRFLQTAVVDQVASIAGDR